jgi:hypothetical protein
VEEYRIFCKRAILAGKQEQQAAKKRQGGGFHKIKKERPLYNDLSVS